MAWWVPLVTMGGQMMQKRQQEEQAQKNRLRFSGGARDQATPMPSSSLLSSVFGIDGKKTNKQSDALGLDKVGGEMGSRLTLEDVGGYEEGLWNGGW